MHYYSSIKQTSTNKNAIQIQSKKYLFQTNEPTQVDHRVFYLMIIF
jgi:hypothetical protein